MRPSSLQGPARPIAIRYEGRQMERTVQRCTDVRHPCQPRKGSRLGDWYGAKRLSVQPTHLVNEYQLIDRLSFLCPSVNTVKGWLAIRPTSSVNERLRPVG